MTTCNYCKKPALFTFKNGVNCCSKNVSGCPEIRQRKKNTCVEKYGDENFKNIEKGKQTKLEKYGDPNFNNRSKAEDTLEKTYGVTNVSKLSNIKQAKQLTFDSNYKVESTERTKLAEQRRATWLSNDVSAIIEKTKNTNFSRYGVDNILKLESVAKEVSRKNKENAPQRMIKARKTIQERYGVDYISQVPEIHDRQQKLRWKQYQLPSGKIIRVQGFENKAMDILLTLYTEEDIITSRKLLPNIWYEHNTKNRIYYPDLMILSGHTIIEVKSEYTYQIYKEVNLTKKDACLRLGYNFEFWIFDNKGSSLRKEIFKHNDNP
jgi:hypothetical protein